MRSQKVLPSGSAAPNNKTFIAEISETPGKNQVLMLIDSLGKAYCARDYTKAIECNQQHLALLQE